MPEERLGGDERDRRDLLEPGLLDLVLGVEQELVGGPEARAALRGADHDRPRVLQEPIPRVASEHRVLEVADRLGIPVVRPETRDLLEREPRPGADEQPVICQFLAGAGSHRVREGVDPPGGVIDEPDPLLRVDRRQRERHVLGLAAAERDPYQRRDERELRAWIQDHDLVTIPGSLLELERRGQPGEARPDDHDTLATGTEHHSVSVHLYNCTLVYCNITDLQIAVNRTSVQLCAFPPNSTRSPSMRLYNCALVVS